MLNDDLFRKLSRTSMASKTFTLPQQGNIKFRDSEASHKDAQPLNADSSMMTIAKAKTEFQRKEYGQNTAKSSMMSVGKE